MNKKRVRFALVPVIVLGLMAVIPFFNRQSYSASLTSVSVTLSNPRLSFRGALGSGNTVGSSQVTITTSSYPSITTAQLVEGDTALIGNAGTMDVYTVAAVNSASVFSITSGLGTGDADSGDDVISTQSATHTVRLTTANAIADGSFRILVPAHATNTISADGMPDQDSFDFSFAGATVACPADVGGTYDFGTGTAAASNVTIDGQDYHSFTCAYTGSGAVGTQFDGNSQGAFVISGLINPAPTSTHSTGTADTYEIIVQQLNTGSAVVDQTTVGVGVIEAVRVTATVAPQITFTIAGISSGATACGQTTDVTTTAAAVPFGEISISSFTDAAQLLTVSTNATNGFAVTAVENDQMGRNGGACAGEPTITGNTNCIADAGEGTFSETTSNEWTSTAIKGFGYSLQDPSSTTTEAFAYNESARTFSSRQFPATADSESAATIFSSTTPSDTHNVNVCYRILAGTTTSAGNYENYVTYTATATF